MNEQKTLKIIFVSRYWFFCAVFSSKFAFFDVSLDFKWYAFHVTIICLRRMKMNKLFFVLAFSQGFLCYCVSLLFSATRLWDFCSFLVFLARFTRSGRYFTVDNTRLLEMRISNVQKLEETHFTYSLGSFSFLFCWRFVFSHTKYKKRKFSSTWILVESAAA